MLECATDRQTDRHGHLVSHPLHQEYLKPFQNSKQKYFLDKSDPSSILQAKMSV